MASCALNDLNVRREGKEPLDVQRSAFKSFNAQLAIDYPAYAMVICQHSHIKDVNNNIWWLMPWSFAKL